MTLARREYGLILGGSSKNQTFLLVAMHSEMTSSRAMVSSVNAHMLAPEM